MVLIKTQRTRFWPRCSLCRESSNVVIPCPSCPTCCWKRRGDRLTLLATDIEIQITTATAGAGGDGDGAVTVGCASCRTSCVRCRTVPKSALVNLDKRLQVRAGKSRFNLQTLPADDFPRMTMNEGETRSSRLTQKAFRQLIGKTQYSMAAQDVRYYLNGLLLLVEGNGTACRGHRWSPPGLCQRGDRNRTAAPGNDPAAQDRARTEPSAGRYRRRAEHHLTPTRCVSSLWFHRAGFQS